MEDIVRRHWRTYGRNYYCRYDYEGVNSAAAASVLNHLRSSFESLQGRKFPSGNFEVLVADEFTYVDAIDGSVSRQQGIRILFTDGSRIVFRLSGTAGSGATVRMYLEKFEAEAVDLITSEALKELVDIALEVSQMEALTGFKAPTVIT